MRGRRERSLGQLLVLASLMVLLCFAAATACEEEEEAIGTTDLPKPTEVIFRVRNSLYAVVRPGKAATNTAGRKERAVRPSQPTLHSASSLLPISTPSK